MSDNVPSAQRRVSITKSQRQTDVAVELISLCQSFTADGTLSVEEINDLRLWLAANRESDLPSILFLVGTVEKILADGKVTEDERRSVYKAIESVLPPDLRAEVVARRRSQEQAERDLERAHLEAEKQQQTEEKLRNRKRESANFMVAGVRHENRAVTISKHVRQGDVAYLKRDPSNAYSRNAIEVRAANGMHIGYVPEDHAVDLAPLLDQEMRHQAYFTKVLTGGRVPIPVVQAHFYGSDATVSGAISQTEVPYTQPMVSRGGAWVRSTLVRWKYVWLAVIAILIIYAFS